MLEQFLHRVLRGLGLQLLRRGNKRHQRDMHKQRILAPEFLPHLANRFNERQRLDVAYRAADFDDATSTSCATFFIAALISLVTCGITCTVFPR